MPAEAALPVTPTVVVTSLPATLTGTVTRAQDGRDAMRKMRVSELIGFILLNDWMVKLGHRDGSFTYVRFFLRITGSY